MEKIFETANGAVLYYDSSQRKLYAKHADVEKINTALKEDAKSVSPVDRLMAYSLLADIELLE